MSSQQECALPQPPKNSPGLSELLLRRRPHVAASLLASIVESSDDGIYSIDLDGNHHELEQGGRAALRIYGR
jgi:hypothetical protein